MPTNTLKLGLPKADLTDNARDYSTGAISGGGLHTALDTLDAAILDTLVNAKGDLIVGTAADAVARQAVGANGTLLLADSAQATGVAWGNALTGDLGVGGKLYVNDTANAGMTVGVTINQGANDNEALAVKSSDVAHGATGVAEADTYGTLAKADATAGGLQVQGYSEGVVGTRLNGVGTADDTTKSIFGRATVEVQAKKISGTGTANPGANANIFGVALHDGATQFIVDVEGDLHVNGSGSLATYDDYDDAALLESASLLMAPARAASMKFRLSENLAEHREALVSGGVLSEGGFISYKGMLGLLIDAVRQLAHQNRTLEARYAALLEAK